MSETASISTGVASRYAKALFDLVLESDEVRKLEKDVESLSVALEISQELRDLISSPLYTRHNQKSAIVAICEKNEVAFQPHQYIGFDGLQEETFCYGGVS